MESEKEIQLKIEEFQTILDKGKDVNLWPRWHTPQEYIDAIREVIGDIELDPASCDKAQERIKAKVYYTPENDAFKYAWYGKTFLNYYYHGEELWVKKLVDEFRIGNIPEAIVLTHTLRTYESWFTLLAETSSAICLVKGQIQWTSDHEIDVEAAKHFDIEFNPKYDIHGSVVFYLGKNQNLFLKVFGQFGVCYEK